MPDRSNVRLNEEIERQICAYRGTVHGIALKNMYERGAEYEDICDVMQIDYEDFVD